MVMLGCFLTVAGTYGSIVGIMDSYKESGGSAAFLALIIPTIPEFQAHRLEIDFSRKIDFELIEDILKPQWRTINKKSEKFRAKLYYVNSRSKGAVASKSIS